MKKNYKDGISENVRIRHYVMGLLYESGTESRKLPSSKTLAEQFGIARSTVLIALKQLEDEGYLTGKRGSGVFTCPMADKLSGRNQKLIGILLSNGDHFYCGKQDWMRISEIGKAITDAGWDIRPIFHLNLELDKNMIQTLKDQALSALVMINSDSRIAHIASEAVPTILIGHQRDEPMPSIRFSYENALKQLRKELHFQRPIFFGKQHHIIRNNFSPFWKGPRIPLSRINETLLPSDPDFTEKLGNLLEKEKPDVVFIMKNIEHAVLNALRELKSDLPVVNWGIPSPNEDFHGFFMREPLEDAGKKVVEMLRESFKNGEFPPDRPELPVSLIRC